MLSFGWQLKFVCRTGNWLRTVKMTLNGIGWHLYGLRWGFFVVHCWNLLTLAQHWKVWVLIRLCYFVGVAAIERCFLDYDSSFRTFDPKWISCIFISCNKSFVLHNLWWFGKWITQCCLLKIARYKQKNSSVAVKQPARQTYTAKRHKNTAKSARRRRLSTTANKMDEEIEILGWNWNVT